MQRFQQCLTLKQGASIMAFELRDARKPRRAALAGRPSVTISCAKPLGAA
jgi:hypothetical protein